MIDLTPLDVRKKRGDFAKGLRGYDPQEVDTFLELVAERLEEIVKENMTLRERSDRLAEQVDQQTGRERAVQDALVTAQQLREEIRTSAERESELRRKEGEAEARRIVEDAEAKARAMIAEAEARVRTTLQDAERTLRERSDAAAELERRRQRFLTSFRQLLERELDAVQVEEGRSPLQDVTIDLELRGGRPSAHESSAGRSGTRGSADEGPADWLEPVGAGSGIPRDAVIDDLIDEDAEPQTGSKEPATEPRSGDVADEDADDLDIEFVETTPAEVFEAVPDAGPASEGPSREDLGFFEPIEGKRSGTKGKDEGSTSEDDDWLDDILDGEADRAERRRDEGE